MDPIISKWPDSLKKTATAALIVLVSAAVALPISAQQAVSAATPAAKITVPTAKPVVQVEEEEAAPTPKKPGQEGIKVHGHWVIDLKDKDGKVIEHRDFQNALSRSDGTNLLANFLTGAFIGVNMEIDAIQSPGPIGGAGVAYSMIPAEANASSHLCLDPGVPGVVLHFCFPGMTTTIVHDQTDSSASIVLHGQFIAAGTAIIDTVLTRSGGCHVTAVDFGPAVCASNSDAPQASRDVVGFTGTTITPITVQQGQQLVVTVTLSFS